LWFGRGLSNKPPIDGNLVGASFLYGAGFVALLNAKTRIGNRELNLRFFYDSCVALAYNIIARAETARTAQFRLEFIRQLTQKATLFEGLKFLESYFLSDISMPPEQKSNSLKALKEIAKTQDAEERAKKAYAVLLVRRKDLPHALAEFGCSDELIAAVAKN
jgi:hypothetical protein